MKKTVGKWMVMVAATGSFAFFSACNSDKKEVSEKETEMETMDMNYQTDKEEIKATQVATKEFLEGDTMDFSGEATEQFKKQLSEVIQPYLKLKEALVEANEKEANNQSSAMSDALKQVDDLSLNGKAAAFWKEKKDFLNRHLELSKEARGIEAKRENFVFISQVMIKATSAYGVGNDNLYIQYCPMANSGKGAYWISQNKEIRNPYMGKKMLTCGETKATL